MFNFFFSNAKFVILVVWVVMAIVAIMRYLGVLIFAHLSWRWLILTTIILHLGYATMLTWGQYTIWEGSEFTRIFLVEPLTPDAPLPIVLEWARPYFSQPLGYFTYYSFGRFFSGLIALSVLTGLLVLFLKLCARYRPTNFVENDITAIALAVLISGWPGVIVLVPLGFIVAVVISIIVLVLSNRKRIYLPLAFLVAAPIAMVLGVSILKFVGLYALLRL